MQQHYQAYYFVLQGCTPALVQPVTPLKDAPDDDCVFFHEWSQQQIEALQPDLVFMSTDTQFEYVDDDGERTSNNQEIAGLIEQGMVDRIEATQPYADRIVVIGDAPAAEVRPERHQRARRHPGGRAVRPQARSMQMRRAVRPRSTRPAWTTSTPSSGSAPTTSARSWSVTSSPTATAAT